MGILRRFANVLRPGRLNRDLDDELDFHRQMRVRKALERGLTAEEAEREAHLRMGNLSVAREEMRDARTAGWISSSLLDLRHGVVLLRRDARISALIVLVLALGIGGNAAIFTLLKAAFLDPLPYRDASRLVTIVEVTGWSPSVSEYEQIRLRNHTLEDLAFAEHVDMQLAGKGDPTRVYAARVTASFFPLLGVNAALGRTLLPEENQPNRTPAVVLTHAFWRSKMGADPGIVGRTLRLDSRPAEIVGVLPPGFHFDYPTLRIQDPVDLYVSFPIRLAPAIEVSSNGLGTPVRVIGRMRDGVTFAQVRQDIRDVARALTTEHPEWFPNPQHDPSLFTFETLPLRDAIVNTQRPLLWLLLGGVGLLLLIACANTAQLLLARSISRGREIAIRSALGASRLRLIRQFFLEAIVLATCGGIAGLLVSGWVTRILVSLLPVRSPLLASARVNVRVVGFTLAISMLSAIIFAIIPAVKGSRWTPGPSLTTRVTAGEGNRWRHVMIAIEAALSVFLLCGAGLVAQNLWTLISTPMGFDPNNVLAMKLKLPASPQSLVDHKAGATFQEYIDRIEAIPGVDSAAIVTGPPLYPARGGKAELIGVTDADGEPKSVTSFTHLVSAHYFRALRIPLLAGRTLSRSDAGNRLTVAVVNEEFARRFGLGADVVGKQLPDPAGPITVVGMVGTVRTRGLKTEPFPELYVSSLQLSWPNVHLVVRSSLPTAQLVKEVKAAIGLSNPDQAVFGVMPMPDMIADAVSQPRFDALLVGSFALLALAMAASGMYSVISCLVSQRTSEIAIRMALGASRGAIVRTILGTTTIWLAIGLGGGLGLSLAARNLVRTLSSAVVTGSPWMYAAVVLFFFVVTLLAALGPMRRASRLDPVVALRCE